MAEGNVAIARNGHEDTFTKEVFQCYRVVRGDGKALDLEGPVLNHLFDDLPETYVRG